MTLDTSLPTPLPEIAETPLSRWVRRMCEVELPSVATTRARIQQLSESDDSALQSLAQLILQDAGMTAHVLRLTNTSYQVPSTKSNSISRALVILGFKEVHSICLSAAVLDDIIKRGQQRSFTTELARAFHAAVQAEQIVCAIGDRMPQEVFIAALLYNLGRLLFLCFAEGEREELEKALQASPHLPESEIEKQVLGFELRELTEILARHWGLGKLLVRALNPNETPNNRINSIRIGQRLSRAVEKGWNSPEVTAIVDELAVLTGMSPPVLLPMLRSAAARAQVVATEFNAENAAEEIPAATNAAPERTISTFVPRDADNAFRLQALQDISLLLESKPSRQELIDLILGGIYGGLGMDRVLFAAISADGRTLEGSSALGFQAEEFIKAFSVTLNSGSNILQTALESSQAIWVYDQKDAEFKHRAKSAQSIIGDKPFFISSIIIARKPIGILFADRAASKRQLTASLFQSFKQFVVTANMSLSQAGDLSK